MNETKKRNVHLPEFKAKGKSSTKFVKKEDLWSPFFGGNIIGSPALNIFSHNSVAHAGSSVLLNKAFTSAVLASNKFDQVFGTVVVFVCLGIKGLLRPRRASISAQSA